MAERHSGEADSVLRRPVLRIDMVPTMSHFAQGTMPGTMSCITEVPCEFEFVGTMCCQFRWYPKKKHNPKLSETGLRMFLRCLEQNL